MDWNPAAPDYVGLEFAARNQSMAGPSVTVSNQTQAVAQRLDSTVTQTVSLMGAYLRGIGSTYRFLAEVLTAGVEVPVPITTTVFAPNANSGGTGWTSTASSIWQALVPGDPGVVQALNQNTAVTRSFALEFATAGQLTGKRILAVRFILTGREGYATRGSGRVPLTITGAGSTWRSGRILTQENTAIVCDSGEIDPDTGLPWTVSAFQAMDTSSYRVGITVSLFKDDGGISILSASFTEARLEVDWVDENRLTTQVVQASNSSAAWVTWIPRKVDNAANFAKVSGTDFTMQLRQPRYGNLAPAGMPASELAFSVPYLIGFADVPPAGLAMYLPTLDPTGAILDLGTEVLDGTIGEHLAVAGTQSVDAQPYARAVAVEVTGTVQQELSGASAQDYEAVFFPAAYLGVPGDLTVQLRRRSDSALLGTATVTPADFDNAAVDPLLGEWRQIQADFAAPVALAAATQYYLAFSAPDTAGAWYVQALASTTTDITGVGSYGGTTDVATYAGGDVPNADLSAGVIVGLAAVTDVTVSPFEDPTGAETGRCGITAIPGLKVEWEPTTEPTFAYYEIQRSDERTDWQPIAHITDPAVPSFSDYESRLGIESCYRVRWFDTVGVHSAWSDPIGDCATATVAGVGYTFTTNEAPEYNLAYGDIHDRAPAVRDYDFPEAGDVVFEEFFMRDYVIAFTPLERRGVVFARRLLVNAVAAPARPGPDTFTPIRDLASAALSYVTVRDQDGNRWFMKIQIARGETHQPGNRYYVPMVGTEVTDLPSTPDVVSSS